MSATAMPPSMTPEQAAAMAAAMAAAAKEIARIGAINKAYFAAIMGVTVRLCTASACLDCILTDIFIPQVWDWFIQLNAEYRHIWKASNTFMKLYVPIFCELLEIKLTNAFFSAYIFCRYWNFGVNILCLLAFHANWTQAKCDHVVRIQAAVSVVTVCSAAMLLLLRARAVWSQSWYITCLLGALLVAEFSVMMVVGQVWGTAVPILTESGKGNCFPSADSRVFLLYWSAPIVFDATATILMLVKSWETYRLGSTVAKVFLRDGLAYFVVRSFAAHRG